jgi:predicted enzyme related to lactoylglutathione lyase
MAGRVEADNWLQRTAPRAPAEPERSVSTKMAGTDRPMTRRNALAFVALPLTAILDLGCTRGRARGSRDEHRSPDDPPKKNGDDTDRGAAMRIHYLEIVTTDVETVCTLYSNMHGVAFGDADQALGGARTARLANGGMFGVRAPMHAGEKPVVRPYILVDDIEAAVAAAAKSGAEIAVPPMGIPGHGTCAIVIQRGMEAGLWQL